MDQSGNPVGGVITVTAASGGQALPTVAFDGANYLVAWTDKRNDANRDGLCDTGEGTCYDVYGQYVSTSGSLVGSEFVINNDAENQYGAVAAFGGGKYLVLINNVDYMDGSVGDVYGVFVTP